MNKKIKLFTKNKIKNYNIHIDYILSATVHIFKEILFGMSLSLLPPS